MQDGEMTMMKLKRLERINAAIQKERDTNRLIRLVKIYLKLFGQIRRGE